MTTHDGQGLALWDDATFASIVAAGAPGEHEAPPLLPCDVEMSRYFAWLAESAATARAAAGVADWTHG